LVIDDELVRRAQTVLGTRGIKDTVDRALEEVIALGARRALIERLETQRGLDIGDDTLADRAWGK